jgi:hypothetical protein
MCYDFQLHPVSFAHVCMMAARKAIAKETLTTDCLMSADTLNTAPYTRLKPSKPRSTSCPLDPSVRPPLSSPQRITYLLKSRNAFCEQPCRCHERLAIVGVDTGAQPLTSDDGKILLAVNGEIYNHRTLRKNLKNPAQFKTHSDCEVIMYLVSRNLEISNFMFL